MSDTARMARRQRVLADFGEFALRSQDLDKILTEACRLVGEALGTARAKILEIRRAEKQLFVRAGVGWNPEIVGKLHMSMTESSSETFAIQAGQPVISEDIDKENRFEVPPFIKDAGVVALANVPILLPGGRPYGLLQVDDTKPHEFGDDEIQFLRTYAAILGPVVDRLLLARALRSTEQRFNLTVEAALDYAIFLSDPQDRITDWLPGAEAVFGWSAEEAIGQPVAITFTPEDREKQQDQWETETARREGVAPNVRWHVRKDGERVFIDGTTRALRDADGTLLGFLKVGQDVTERRAAVERLRESEERFRQFGDASSDFIWIRNAETLQFEYVSPAFETIFGELRDDVRADDDLAHWTNLIFPDDREQMLARLRSVRAGERITHEFRIVRPSDGETRWVRNTDFPIFDGAGHVQRIAGISEDVTEEKASADRMELLIAELQHRSRNLLGVVASVASKTLGDDDAAEKFQARLQALSRAQGLLSQFGSDSAEIGALVRAELEAHTDIDPPNITVDGPRVHLTARQVQNFSLAMHELATNAVKYGALRGEVGSLSVTWGVNRDEKGRPWLALSWIERGVEVQLEKVQEGGYGRQLIEKALSYALQAKTEYAIDESGVRCRIELPLD
ncbi:PAS domain S-box protein [Plastoroseomonas hellenica]|uniref:PAS domain S-box protein n=1 Tax=Plastoroseomonas hellenica TaxID=2687306 RepID=UPI001BA9FA52|nr:PAS domain S-box protein [Plastoroseomonas hellenica]MBR0646849.1 PAS domain S-box protein [Plastoroseomonas hellenica]